MGLTHIFIVLYVTKYAPTITKVTNYILKYEIYSNAPKLSTMHFLIVYISLD